MTHFLDLSDYSYTSRQDSLQSRAVLNVGWLAAGREFPRCEPRVDLVEALLTCCTAAVEFHRGYHECDLRPHAEPGFDTMELNGRTIRLGNGQIRIPAENEIIYVAPTLVAHYVANHQYCPPAEFVEAVMNQASAIRGWSNRIHRLPHFDWQELCFEIVSSVVKHQCPKWAPDTTAAMRGAIEVTRTTANRDALVEGVWDFIAFSEDDNDEEVDDFLREQLDSFASFLISDRSEIRMDETIRLLLYAESVGVKHLVKA
jgi:hypothetical protein